MKGPVRCRLSSGFPSRLCFAIQKQPPNSLFMKTVTSNPFACPNLERFLSIPMKMAHLQGGGRGWEQLPVASCRLSVKPTAAPLRMTTDSRSPCDSLRSLRVSAADSDARKYASTSTRTAIFCAAPLRMTRVGVIPRLAPLAQDFGCGLTLTPAGATAAPAGGPGSRPKNASSCRGIRIPHKLEGLHLSEIRRSVPWQP